VHVGCYLVCGAPVHVNPFVSFSYLTSARHSQAHQRQHQM
jgi:hypothetical protein